MNCLTKTSAGDLPPIVRNDNHDYVCWSRMQSEAGQDLETIVSRKECERRAGAGIFLWGVGNAPAVAVSALARAKVQIPVVFSVMKSRPKAADCSPSRTVAWRRYVDSGGAEKQLPPNAIVTSRADSMRGFKRAHYALMCYSDIPLRLTYEESFDVTAYRNVSGAGAKVGASQVTALLRRVALPNLESSYQVNLRAWLALGYWVRLSDPCDIPQTVIELLGKKKELGVSEWLSLAQEVRRQPAYVADTDQRLLF